MKISSKHLFYNSTIGIQLFSWWTANENRKYTSLSYSSQSICRSDLHLYLSLCEINIIAPPLFVDSVHMDEKCNFNFKASVNPAVGF